MPDLDETFLWPDKFIYLMFPSSCELRHDTRCTLLVLPHDTNLGSLILDNDLLREIGTRKIPAKGQEEEKKWRDGLTAVVHELRSTNRGKDVAVIAQRIAEFRREFRGGDPSKTLLLD